MLISSAVSLSPLNSRRAPTYRQQQQQQQQHFRTAWSGWLHGGADYSLEEELHGGADCSVEEELHGGADYSLEEELHGGAD